jgi:NAD(P)-dependent dehydrogenase (short-subunit alcohol dehydrogenase family)
LSIRRRNPEVAAQTLNNAGITVDKTVRKMTVDDWHAVLRVNLPGAFYMTKAVLESGLVSPRAWPSTP